MPDKPVRQVADSRVLAAMSHPLRRRLLDVLKVEGPATASMLAEQTGAAVGNISHHIRVLAACDLVEEAPELARDRREHWWRPVSAAIRWSSRDFENDPATEAVAMAAASLGLERQAGLVRDWHSADADQRAAWGEGPFSTDSWIRVTPDELVELSAEIIAVIRRWADRDIPDDGKQRGAVFVFAHGVPATP